MTAAAAPDLTLMTSQPRGDYTLVDSGDGRKYERYGDFHFTRPEPQAMWSPQLDDWPADAEFIPASDEDGGGRWHYANPAVRDGWELTWNGEVRFHASCTPFRHLGFFPDMDPVWRWMREQIAGMETPQVMNLFGYTGVGTLVLSAAGAHMVHVDASKKSVAQARDNAALSGMADRPIRWLVEDAAKFTAREVRRGRRYDGILLDPPKFGRGPNGEIWRIEMNLPDLIADCRQLVDADSRFVFLTVYAVRMSPLALEALMQQHFGDLPGKVEAGELTVAEEGGRLMLPTALFARWSAA
ncbi:MAG: class I SAM-dependent methyltransferase [Pseudomonadota bacterium]